MASAAIRMARRGLSWQTFSVVRRTLRVSATCRFLLAHKFYLLLYGKFGFLYLF